MFSRFAALLSFVLVSLSCSQPGRPSGIARVSVLPFENLSGDASLDWVADAAAPVLLWQLAAAQDLAVSGARNSSGAHDQGAQRVLRGTVEREKAGAIRIDSWLEDRASHRQLALETYRAKPDQTLLDAFSRIAASLGSQPRPYATKSVDALRALTQARSLADPAAARERFQAALTSDPAFSAAHLAWAEFEVARGDRQAAQRALASFRQAVPAAGAGEQAQADLLDARLRGDSLASATALKQLAVASPANAALQRLAASTFEQFQWAREAADSWQRYLRVYPDQPDALRGLAYAKSWQNDYPAARELLARYRAVAPQDLNTLDSLGEIEFQAGRFEEAAKVFEQMSRTPASNPQAPQFIAAGWSKAAYARLMLGDEKSASALFEKGLEARKLSGPVALLQRATWLFETGHRQQAFSQLVPPPDAAPPVKALFVAQACWFHAAAGDWARARATIQGQPTSAEGLLCAFASLPEGTEAEWIQLAERQFAGPQLTAFRQRALGYALALRGHYAAAVAPLREALRDGQDATEVRLLLARCYLQLKQWPQLREVTQPWPVPPTLQPLFNPVFFPSQLELRGLTELHYERAVEAKRWLDLHQRYSR